MKAIRRILLAVKDPDSRRQAGIDKAIDIAKRLGASLELFHAISAPVFLDLQPLTGTSTAELKREVLQQRLRRLNAHATRANARGVDATCKVQWDYPPHEAIVRRARRGGADLIIAECHQGSRLKPWLMHLTDWELLRTSPVPVLLFKNPRRYLGPPFSPPSILLTSTPSRRSSMPESSHSENGLRSY